MELSPKEKIETLCEELNIPEPVGFLTSVMGGTDPRRVSQVYQRVIALVEEYGEEPPDAWEWQDLVEMITSEYRGSIIGIKQSQEAAKQLLEYMHPKKKAVEVTTDSKPVEAKKLTRLDIRRLRKAFDLDY